MFSSFNTFLPSVLHKSPSPQPTPQITIEDDEGDEEDKRKTNKEKKANETFIFVRPPPAKSNHPLNLQVQLVPPNSRAPGGLSTSRQSIDGGDTHSVEEVPLSRTSSNRSDYSSTASISSFSSTATGGRRTIIPLYNLQAHNVLTNTIVDAGTDAKIAKFAKRGIDMIDLATMEPVEVWAANTNAQRFVAAAAASLERSGSTVLGSRPTTPAPTSPGSSAISLASAGSSLTTPPIPSSIEPKKKENLFGRMFRKKDVAIIPDIPTPILESPAQTPKISRHSRHLSASSPYMPRSASPSPNRQRMSLPVDPEKEIPSQIYLPATLGIQPLLNISMPPPPNPATHIGLSSMFVSCAYPPAFKRGGNPFVGRGPVMYVWTVRRWAKGDSAGGSVLAGMLSGGRSPVTGDGVDLRVEWRRAKAKRSSRKDDEQRKEKSTERAERRKSVASVSSFASTEAGGSRLMRRQRTVDLDSDGDDSEPEDSETPWTCTVRVKRIAPSASPSSPTISTRPSPGSAPTGSAIKVKVGTLSPTPHHPKVVAMLKVPYPLPDVEVDRVRVVKRKIITVGRDGEQVSSDEDADGDEKRRVVVSDGAGKMVGLVLTAEEIKDVVCSTGLWLVVREGFGGVGKVSRKGDGWRIRA